MVKYVALIIHFNFVPAFCAMWGVCFLNFGFQIFFFDQVPASLILNAATQVDGSNFDCTFLTEMVAPVTFLVVLFTGHYFRSQVSLFLDICCIPQDDKDKQALGITSLGAVLDRSEKMLILMDEHYWKRLWCVFEVAAFYHRAGSQRMEIVPLHVPVLQFAAIISIWAYTYISYRALICKWRQNTDF